MNARPSRHGVNFWRGLGLLAGVSWWLSGTAVGAESSLAIVRQRAIVHHANAVSAHFQRANVQLVAPELREQIQELADELGVVAGARVRFRVFLINENFLAPVSFDNGDIFLPTGYLDMIENRDELAFGLAREIALQVQGERIKELEAAVSKERRRALAATACALVVNSAVATVHHRYVVGPIVRELAKGSQVPPFPPSSRQAASGAGPSPVRRGPGNLILPHPPATMGNAGGAGNSWSIQAANLTALLTTQQTGKHVNMLLGWIPNLLSERTQILTAGLIDRATEDVDATKRHSKDLQGTPIMEQAGYDAGAARNVTRKMDEFWAFRRQPENAASANE